MKVPPDVAPDRTALPAGKPTGEGQHIPIPRTTHLRYRKEGSTSETAAGGFAQLLPIVQWFVTVHLNHIEEAARGTLASGPGGPSEEVAIECLLRIFEGSREKVDADKETLEAYMRARTWEWWQDFPERRLLTNMVGRADRRKKGIGSADSRRRPYPYEGLRIARPVLAGIPDKISLDSEGEYEGVSNLLAALLSPPMGEPSPERLQRYTEPLQVHPDLP